MLIGVRMQNFASPQTCPREGWERHPAAAWDCARREESRWLSGADSPAPDEVVGHALIPIALSVRLVDQLIRSIFAVSSIDQG